MISGGARGNRTLDLLHAMQTLYQLSYDPYIKLIYYIYGIEAIYFLKN